MVKSAGNKEFLLKFVPEQWDAIERFAIFKYRPLVSEKYYQRGIKATKDHIYKFRVLKELANDLIPGFQVDKKEFNKTGHTQARHSKQFSAVAECCINELYAALDGIKDIIYSIFFSSVKGIQKKSVNRFFLRAKDNKYGKEFPPELNKLLSNAYEDWFLQLRKYRTEFIHGSLGLCIIDKDIRKISYIHPGIVSAGVKMS